MEEEEKLQILYNDCIEELKTIGIEILDNPLIGEIDIRISEKNIKRYGCCKHEEPCENYYHIEKRGNNLLLKYDRFHKHHIEISKWVMQLDEKIIKNTIIHEIIHCFPECNNHKRLFKDYASYINQKLGYNITRLGNKEADYKKSNLDFEKDSSNFKYKIVCQECGYIYYRKRLKKNLIIKYRCSKCGGRLQLNHC